MAKPLNILITAGPTREYLDPVRYLSNDSSGQMGFALASAAQKLGHQVNLIAGPVQLETPKNTNRIDVVSADEMHKACMKLGKKADVIIMAAAVADFKPARTKKQKIKSRPIVQSSNSTIVLKKNSDILEELGRKKNPHQTIIGFALETQDLEKNAKKKLKNKNCNWIIANKAETIASKNAKTWLYSKVGTKHSLPKLPKEDLAFLILSHILT